MLSQKIIDMLNDIITDDLAKEFGEDSKDAVINKLVNYNPDSYNLIHKIREYSQKKWVMY